MDGTKFTQDKILCASTLEFCDQPGIKLSAPTIWIKKFNLPYQLILGLNLLLDKNETFILTPDIFHISRRTISVPTQPSELREKHGGLIQEKPDLELDIKATNILVSQQDEEEFEFFEYTQQDDQSPTEIINFIPPKRKIKIHEFAVSHLSLVNSFFALGNIKSEKDLNRILHELDILKVIGENPLEHWEKNGIECKLDILNPDHLISTAQIEFSNLDQEECKAQIDELLKLKIISPSISPHRSTAFMERNHNEIKRGKARMVINYKRLNDNTKSDSYNLPMKNQLINAIQGAKICSKFDLKSGFYQIKMSKESIPWTTFTCSEGLFKWNAMPFGLKNAPAVFQRKMDNIFRDLKKFVVVYIDDILVFSKDYNTHLEHLQLVFKKFVDHGLIVSKKNIELAKPEINFLGTIIGNGEIKLQPHIAQKILDMPDSFKDLKELQKFLGILNYARDYIHNLSRKAGPLFAKLRKTGQQHFNFQDTKLVQEIKEIVKTLPSFKLPLDSDYLIIHTDACKLGWGAVLYCKPNKYSPKDSERMCR